MSNKYIEICLIILYIIQYSAYCQDFYLHSVIFSIYILIYILVWIAGDVESGDYPGNNGYKAGEIPQSPVYLYCCTLDI